MSISEKYFRKLRGDSRFVSDITPENTIYGLTIRAAVARGEIVSLTLPELPAGYFFAGCRDIPGKKTLSVLGKEVPILAEKTVSYFGEPVMLACGPDKELLKQLAARVKMEYREDSSPALTPDTIRMNSLQDHLKYHSGESEAVFNTAKKIIRTECRTALQIPYNIEPEAAVAICGREQAIIYSSGNYPYNIRNNIASLLNLPGKNVRVIVPDTSSPAGGKIIIPAFIAAHTALLSWLSGQPVKMEYSQAEDIGYGVKKYPCRISCKSALDKEGVITANQLDLQIDTGCYTIFAEYLVKRMIATAAEFYSCRNLSVNLTLNATDKAPLGGFDGIGEGEICFAMELHANRIARLLQADPLNWKLKNLLPDLKSRNRLPAAAVLEKVVAVSDFRRKYGAYAAQTKTESLLSDAMRPIRGIGLALCPHRMLAGYENDLSFYTVSVVFGKDRKLRIKTSAVDLGDSKATLFAMLASSILNIHISEVVVEQVDTFNVPDTGATAGAKAVNILARLIEQCCQTVKRKLKKDPLPISAQKKCALPLNPGQQALTWEATVVEVEIDPVTCEIDCRGIWIVMEAGRIVNPEITRNHIEAAAFLNFEYAHTEIKDFEHLMDYTVPGALDLPPIHIHFLENNEKRNIPKSLGEQVVCGVAPAYLSAVSQACSMDLNQVPVIPETIQGSRRIS